MHFIHKSNITQANRSSFHHLHRHVGEDHQRKSDQSVNDWMHLLKQTDEAINIIYHVWKSWQEGTDRAQRLHEDYNELCSLTSSRRGNCVWNCWHWPGDRSPSATWWCFCQHPETEKENLKSQVSLFPVVKSPQLVECGQTCSVATPTPADCNVPVCRQMLSPPSHHGCRSKAPTVEKKKKRRLISCSLVL